MGIEQPVSIEARDREETSKIVLKFFRHSIKEDDPKKTDQEISLTPEGKMFAKSRSSAETNVAQSVAFGSPRVRIQETAALVMAGAQDDITGTETLDELRGKLDTDLAKGTKIGVSDLLDFTVDDTSAFGKIFFTAYREGRYLEFIVQESDQMAVELQDSVNDTYSRMASRIALIVKKYVSITPRFDALVTDPSKHYTDTMERFLGTHQGVAESFLAKVIEKTKGVSERDRLVAVLGNRGFDFAEGFGMDIRSFANGERKLHLTFKKEKGGAESFVFDEDVPMEMIDEIVSEGSR